MADTEVISIETGRVVLSKLKVRALRPFWVIEADGSKRVAAVGEVLKLSRWDAAGAVNGNRAEYVSD